MTLNHWVVGSIPAFAICNITVRIETPDPDIFKDAQLYSQHGNRCTLRHTAGVSYL